MAKPKGDQEVWDIGMVILAAYDPDAEERLEAAWQQLGGDAASRADLFEDLGMHLAEHLGDWEFDKFMQIVEEGR